MRTVRYEPRRLLADPKDFGRAEEPEWVHVDVGDHVKTALVDAADLHHRIARSVRAKGKTLGYSPPETAAELDIPVDRYGRLIRGEVVLQIDMLFRLARWTEHVVTLEPERADDDKIQALVVAERSIRLRRLELEGIALAARTPRRR